MLIGCTSNQKISSQRDQRSNPAQQNSCQQWGEDRVCVGVWGRLGEEEVTHVSLQGSSHSLKEPSVDPLRITSLQSTKCREHTLNCLFKVSKDTRKFSKSVQTPERGFFCISRVLPTPPTSSLPKYTHPEFPWFLTPKFKQYSTSLGFTSVHQLQFFSA